MKDEIALKQELHYLLHVKKVGCTYERTGGDTIAATIKNLVSSPSDYIFNERVMTVMIETGYIQQEVSFLNPGEYPNFLKHILHHSHRIKLKEAACRQIIKLFGLSPE